MKNEIYYIEKEGISWFYIFMILFIIVSIITLSYGTNFDESVNERENANFIRASSMSVFTLFFFFLGIYIGGEKEIKLFTIKKTYIKRERGTDGRGRR